MGLKDDRGGIGGKQVDYANRATHVRINLRSLRNNLERIRGCLSPRTRICAAIKADAYGHGSVPVARTLRKAGVYMLGVSSPLEALPLREAGDTGPVLLYGPTVPEEIALSIDLDLELMLTDRVYLGNIENELARGRRLSPLRLHLKVDTGMGRIGCQPDEALELAWAVVRNPRLELAGLATHFPSADSEGKEDMEFTRRQIGVFQGVVESLERAGIRPAITHMANSGAVALHSDSAREMVRPGLALYGYQCDSGLASSSLIGLEPVMELCSRVTALRLVPPGGSVSYGRTWTASRPTWIGTVPVGYADGYPRCLSNRASVLIHGRRYPVAGRVCMDQLMVDLGTRTDVCLYDSVRLFGPGEPDAAELARLAGTIPYEITCGITRRVPRVYLEE